MRHSADRILTSHVGSLPRPDALIEANRAREAGETTDETAFQQTLKSAVAAHALKLIPAVLVCGPM